jgi:imidazole glycerol-phosphate synthase subunit HisH
VGRPGPDAADVVLAETTHGSTFASAVARGNLLGVQFHPERSGRDGLRLLGNVVGWAAGTRRAA